LRASKGSLEKIRKTNDTAPQLRGFLFGVFYVMENILESGTIMLTKTINKYRIAGAIAVSSSFSFHCWPG